MCGDGLDLGLNECEDGNNFDQDGCNSACQVELDYECFSASSTGPFYCKSLKPPSLNFVTVADDMTLELHFSEPVLTTEVLGTDDISISI